MTLHFVNRKANSQNQTFSNWFKLELHQDYIDCLRDLGHPPPTETRALIQDLKELEQYRLGTQELKEPKPQNQDLLELERLRIETQELEQLRLETKELKEAERLRLKA